MDTDACCTRPVRPFKRRHIAGSQVRYVYPVPVADFVDQGEIVECVQIEIARQVELLTVSVRDKSGAVESVARLCVVVQHVKPGQIIYREWAVGANEEETALEARNQDDHGDGYHCQEYADFELPGLFDFHAFLAVRSRPLRRTAEIKAVGTKANEVTNGGWAGAAFCRSRAARSAMGKDLAHS